MGLTLITGPADSGKTTLAVERLGRFSPLELAGAARYVVPTNESARRVEHLVMKRLGTSGLLGNVFCTFFSFAQEFVAAEGLSSRLISDVKKELTLSKLVREANPEYLARSAESPGFIRALDAVIGELKVSLVDPKALKTALAAEGSALTGPSRAKLEELCELYGRYQDEILLVNNLHDREGLMWRALEIADGGKGLRDLQVVVFDGFDVMNAVERKFLETVVKHVPEVMVALRYEADRPEIFGPAEETRRFVLSLGADEVMAKEAINIHPTGPQGSLAHLARNLFIDGAGRMEAGAEVAIIEGCDTDMEVELAAEEIGRLTRAGHCDWGDILVTARDMRGYRDRVADIFAEHGIPLDEPKRPLAETALARLLVACLNIVRGDWPRDEVVRFLKSEMVSEDQEAACRVELQAKKRALVGGRVQWRKEWGAHDQDLAFRRKTLRPLMDFEKAVREERSLPAMAEAARALVDTETFKWRGHDDRCLAEDAAAHARLTEIFKELEESAGLLGPTNAFEFFNRLEEIIYLTDYELPAAGTNAVRLAPVTGIGGQRYRAAFVLGMLEKSFPRPPREEPFFRDRERAALNRRLGGALERRLGQGAAGERLLFYTAVTAATDHLYVCYPITEGRAKDSLPSFYLDEVSRLLEGIPRRRRDHAGLVPAPDKVFGLAGLKRSVAYALAHYPAQFQAGSAYNQLLEFYPGLFAGVWRDSVRRGARLTDPLVLADLALPDRHVRCTEVEVYASCPFRHFCTYTLRLKSIREEVDALDFGGLLHDVLYQLFRELRAEYGKELALGRLDPERTVSQALDLLEKSFSAHARMGNMPPYEQGLLEHDLKTALARYVRQEIDHAVPGFTPALFELEFGGSGGDRDDRSTEAPLVIAGDDGARVLVAGKMDRVDISPGGALVIDYKSGSAPSLTKYEEGLNFQPLLYARALKDVFGIEPVGAEYRPIKQWKPDGLYAKSAEITGRTRGRDIADEDFDAALDNCARLVLDLSMRLRAGRIEIDPRDCGTYCDFSGICRRDKNDLSAGGQ